MAERAFVIGRRRNVEYLRAGKRVPLWLECQYRFYDKFVFSKIRRAVGVENGNIFPTAGAPLSDTINEFLHICGINIVYGYGLSETTATVSCFDLVGYEFGTVGSLMPDIQVKLGENNEILVKGKTVMKGYYRKPEETARVFTEDGWFRTGDVGGFNELGLLSIKGRIKEIIVTSTGEKVPPADLEAAIETDPLFSQCYVIGENRPYLSLITVVNPDEWASFAKSCGVDPADPASLDNPSVKTAALKRAKTAAGEFPHYALPRAVVLTQEPWTIENGLITPTLKLKRGPLSKKFANVIAQLYATHG